VTIPPLGGVFAEPWSAGKLRRMLAMFGPAAIVASVAIGAGETIIVVRTGSWAGYGLMWLVLLSVLVKGVFVTYLIGRFTAVSGQYLGHRLVHLPGPRGWFLLTIIAMELLAAPPVWAAVAKPCGNLLRHLLHAIAEQLGAGSGLLGALAAPAASNVLTCLFVLTVLFVALGISYERLEKQQVIICGILVVGTAIGTLMVWPDFGQAFVSCFRFGDVPAQPPWTPEAARQKTWLTVATTFGYVGSTVMGYIVYANWIGLHRWGLTGHPDIDDIRRRAAEQKTIDYLPSDPEQVRRLRRSLGPLRWDVGMGAVVLFLVTASFMAAGAAVLYPMLERGELNAAFEGWSLLTDQAYIWRNIHPLLVWVYYVCVLVALWGTLQAFPEIYARVTKEFCDAIWPASPLDFRRLQWLIFVYLLVGTFAVIWSPVRFDTLTHVVAFLASNFSVALIMVAVVYLDRTLPKAYRTRRPMFVGAVLSAVVLLCVSAISGYGLLQEILHAVG